MYRYYLQLLIATFVVIILLINPAWSVTDPEGAQSGVWTSDGNPYRVLGDSIYVSMGDTLIIEAGVEVAFYGDRGFWITGTLLVRGEASDSVIFGPSGGGRPGSWRGVTFYGPASSNSEIEAMKLDFGTNNIHVISSSPTFRGIHSHGASINCIRSQNGNPEFYNALLTQDTSRPCESAFAASGGAPKIFGDIIVCSPAGENGVLVVDGANPEIQDLTILNPHDNGVYFQGLPRGLVTNCWIGRPGLRGINISDCYNINISRVAINQPVGTGIYTNRGTGSIHHCTIYRAGLGQSLDGIFIAGDNATWVVHSNIFSGCGGYGIRSTVANVTTSYCCFWQNGTDTHGGHAGSGSFDIFVNPELIIPTLELMDTSPCIDDGNPNTQYNDPDGTRGDMGAIFFDQNTPPEINTHSPQSLLLDGYAWGDVVEFSVTATDPDNDPLEYSWYYLGVLRSTTPEATITLVNNEILEDVTVTVYDGLTGYDSVRWDVRAVGVEDFSNTILPERFEISSIYPNPFNPSAQVTIAVDEPGLLVYTVYDLLGRELYSNKQNVIPGYTNFEIGGSDWGSGIYFLSVNLNESRETKKMVLIR